MEGEIKIIIVDLMVAVEVFTTGIAIKGVGNHESDCELHLYHSVELYSLEANGW